MKKKHYILTLAFNLYVTGVSFAMMSPVTLCYLQSVHLLYHIEKNFLEAVNLFWLFSIIHLLSLNFYTYFFKFQMIK